MAVQQTLTRRRRTTAHPAVAPVPMTTTNARRMVWPDCNMRWLLNPVLGRLTSTQPQRNGILSRMTISADRLGRRIGEIVRQNGFEPAGERLVVHGDERRDPDDVARHGDTE